MTELRKATLLEIDNDGKPKSGKDPIPVQFNPAALRMQFSNQSEGGQQSGRQARQYTGTGSTTLSLELVFDTADEGTTQVPQSVLERTEKIEYFMKPQGAGGKNQAPPRLRFQWGNLVLDGVMENLSLDLDHFAHDGTPLRAKMNLSIKGQNPEYQFNKAGPGANDTVGPSPAAAAASAAQPGVWSSPLSDAMNQVSQVLQDVRSALNQNVVLALDGESLAGLAQRAGLDPAAWRGLAQGLSNPLSLKAGTQIGIGGGIGLSLGLGVKAGVSVGANVSTSARVGLSADTAGSPSRLGAELNKGYAVAAAGGVGAALETVKADSAVQGAHAARQAFVGAGGTTSGAAPVDPISSAAGTAGSRNTVFSMRADSRATTYGIGVPLRDRIQVGHDDRANLISGQTHIRSKAGADGLPPSTSDPTTPGWQALQAGRTAPRSGAHTKPCRCPGCKAARS
jgi:hypothetical protein